MLSFFRRALTSWFFLGLLGLILVAFIITGVNGPKGYMSGDPGEGGDTVAVVGGKAISDRMVTERAQAELRQAQQRQPDATMAQLIGGGGLDALVEQMVVTEALGRWAAKHGMVASERLIDGEIASIPAFAGATGAFSEQQMRAALARQRMSERQLRDEIRGELVRRQLLTPLIAGGAAPNGVGTAYASLLLEARRGQVALVPLAKFAGGAAPSPAELEAFYRANLPRYSVGERRVLRYAVFDRTGATPAAPTEAEIAAAYKADAARYGASETRTFSQVILPDEAQARAFAAKLRGGQTFAAAAAAAGFQPADTSLGSPTREALARTTSSEIAAAAYAAPAGAATPPLKSELGWHIVHVDAVKASAARTLAQARPEIVAALAKKKSDDALAALVNRVQDAVDGGATFDDVVKSNKLTAVTTPPLLSTGTTPDTPVAKPAPDIQTLLKPGFVASPDDDPTVETLVPNERFALLAVGQVLPPAPLPFAQIHARVAADFVADRAAQRARAVAQAILAKAQRGVALGQAVSEAGLGLPAPQPVDARQIDIARAGRPVPPAVQTLFRLNPGRAELVAAPGLGWFVVRLDSVTPGDARTIAPLVAATRGELGRTQADELVRQFAAAAAREVGVKRYPQALERLRQALLASPR